ncbi:MULTISPECIES: hypothetical protein [unclassified Microcoleus]|uniref:hypothetical protein n=1 Tax=unclassified Microcoleus TaxID=2642155 RepID=UPI002FD2A12D
MSQTTRTINYTKWGFILGTPIAFFAFVATAATVPEFRCSIDKTAAICSEQRQNIELYTQSEAGEYLADVKIIFTAKGPPETQYTDNNGYVKVRIPTKGDVRVNLSKVGYPTQNFTINLENDQSITRIIRFTKSGQPIIEASSPTSQSPSSLPSPSSSSSPSSVPPTPTATTTEVKCEDVSRNGNNDYDYDNLISVAKRTEQPSSYFQLSASRPKSFACKIINNSGEIKLAYGLPDNSNLTRVSVKIYVDGIIRKDLVFGRGQAIRESLDIKGASGYTINFEVVPKNAEFSGDVYNLLPKP